MKIPDLSIGQSLEDYIAVFNNPEKFANWLEGLRDFEEKLNEKIGKVNKISKIDEMLAQATAKNNEATALKAQIQQKIKEAEDSAKAIIAEAQAAIEFERKEFEGHKKAVSEKHTALTAREKEVSETMERAQRLISESEKRMARAEETYREGMELKEKFEDKMAQLGALAK